VTRAGLVAAVVVLACGLCAGSAVAATCPPAPAAYTGTDDAATEVNALRAENADACTVQTDEQAQVVGWLKALFVLQLAIGATLVVLLAAAAVVVLFRGS